MLPPDVLDRFLEEAVEVERFTGGKGIMARPRREVCFTPRGEVISYHDNLHPTRPYPKHLKDVLPLLFDSFQILIPDNKYKKPSVAVDIIYSSEYPRGGSIGQHSDWEEHWGLVPTNFFIIFFSPLFICLSSGALVSIF